MRDDAVDDDDDDDEWEGGPYLLFIFQFLNLFLCARQKNKLNFFATLWKCKHDKIKFNNNSSVIVHYHDELYEKSFQLRRVINELSFFGWSSVNLFKLVFII